MEGPDTFYGNLTLGYNIVRPMRIDISGGYGTSFGNNPEQLYTAALLVTVVPFYTLTEKGFLLESSIGAGVQRVTPEKKTLFTVPVKIRAAYYITPHFGLGMEVNTYISKKDYSIIQIGILAAFRF